MPLESRDPRLMAVATSQAILGGLLALLLNLVLACLAAGLNRLREAG